MQPVDLQLQEALLGDPLGLVLLLKDLVNLIVSSHVNSERPPLYEQWIVHGVVVLRKQVERDGDMPRWSREFTLELPQVEVRKVVPEGDMYAELKKDKNVRIRSGQFDH